MRKDILPFYRALGLSPGAEAIDIRRAYRQMIQQWHPDLFKPGSPMQTTAEDITKEINEAYEQLYRKKLYRNFLPKSERKEEARLSPEEGDKPRPAKAPAPKTRSKPGKPFSWRWDGLSRERLGQVVSKVLGSTGTRVTAGACIVALVLVAARSWLETADFSTGDQPTAVQSKTDADPQRIAVYPAPVARAIPSRSRTITGTVASVPTRPLPLLAPKAEAVATWPQFGPVTPLEFDAADESGNTLLMDKAAALLDVIELGDSRARVRAVQGVPDEVSDSIFRYGSSIVYFREGRVSAWRNRLPRLRIRDWSANVLPTLDRFSIGSSRGDVVRAQGLPGAFDATSYVYGSSVISFERGQVSGWSEGDVALQHFDMPKLPFMDLDRMALWGGRAF